MRERGIFFALLAGMGAMTYHSTSNPGSSPPQVQATEATLGKSTSAESELAKTFEIFDKRCYFQISTKSGSLRLAAEPLRDLKIVPGARRFDWVLAIVPDPEHSNLKLDFDRDLEAIQLAATKSDYQFERYWLPWKADPASERERPYIIRPESSDPSDDETGLRVAREKDGRAGLPGVLLFRNGVGDPLAIFLVSESPTGGIAPEEFRNAVQLGRTLSSLDGMEDDGHLRIIGPGMSGSLASLSTFINTQLPPFSEIFVRTWTQDHESHEQFRKLVPDAEKRTENVRENAQVDSSHFKPVELDSIPAKNRFVNYVRNSWHDDNPILLLTEETTAFGGGLEYDSEHDKHPEKVKGVYTIAFPRNLSQLRNASERQDHIPGFGDTSHRADVPRNGILLSLKQDGGAALELPTFSKEQTPVSQESVLFTIGGLLKTGTVHYVGIFATDPLDTLFLARYLRSACPNVRTFTLNPDLLFEHGSDSSDYSGILGISTFPLIPLTQVWSDPHALSLHVFPNDISEAVYNSTQEVLRNVPGSPTHNFSPAAVDRRDLVDPFSRTRDALWLTVAGRSGFEPIDVIDDPNKPSQPISTLGRRFPPEYWPGWGYAFMIISSLCIAFCALMLFARPSGRRTLAFFTAQLDEDDLAGTHDPMPRAFYLYSMGMCLTSLLAIWAAVPAFILQWNVVNQIPHQLEIAGCFLFAAGIAMVLVLRFGFSVPHHFAKKLRAGWGGLPRLHPAESTSALAVSGSVLLSTWVLLRPPLGLQQSSVLPHLWVFFCIGCLCIGATACASALPIWNALQLQIRQRGSIRKYTGAYYLLGIIAIAVFVGSLIGCAAFRITSHSPLDFLAAYRSLDLTNGVSPLVPISLLFVALAALAFVQLRRMAYYDERCPKVPGMGDIVRPTLNSLVEEIKTRIRTFTIHPLHWLMMILLVSFVCGLFPGAAETLEARSLEWLMLFAALAAGTFVVLIWIRLILVWSAFSELLQQLERHPIRQVFSLLPRGFIWSPVWQGGGKKRIHVAITRSIECMQALLKHDRTPRSMKEKLEKQLDSMDSSSLVCNTKNLLEAAAKRERYPRSEYSDLEKALQEVAEMAMGYLDTTTWSRGDYELKTELASKEETKDALHTSRPEYFKQEPATICSELIAFRFLAFINFVLWHIDNLVTYISAGFLLLLVALNSYAFRSRTIIECMMMAMFLILTAGIVIVFAQADRDAILSRITGTEEGKLDRHFFSHLISYGGVPALVLLATHFPVVGKFFFSWVKPALEAIH